MLKTSTHRRTMSGCRHWRGHAWKVWPGSTCHLTLRLSPPRSASMPGTAPMRRAGAWRRSRASGRSSPALWRHRLPIPRCSRMAANWPPGSGLCPGRTPPAADNGSAKSPNRAINICAGCSLPGPCRWSATRNGEAQTGHGLLTSSPASRPRSPPWRSPIRPRALPGSFS